MLRRQLLLAAAVPARPATRFLIVAGPSQHPPGTHESDAGARLTAHCLRHMTNVPGVEADVFYDWPAKTDGYAGVVFLGDTFPPQRLPETARILAELDQLMARGVGLALLHYATGLRAEDVTETGDHPLLRWTGGYFATKNRHHQSVAKVFANVTVVPASPKHPISRGWKTFTADEEPYYNNYFGPDGNRMARNVTPLATAMLPPEAPKKEVIAWCTERPDGGRGFAVVMPHFYENWLIADMRRFLLNGIVWSGGLAVPKGGVDSPAPDALAFGPEAVKPRVRPK